MSGTGVGAELFARSKRFDYHTNSNLVLTAERSNHGVLAPPATPESLWGRMNGIMGDRVGSKKLPRSIPIPVSTKKSKRSRNEDDHHVLKVQEIDAYWLQREISKVFSSARAEANQSQKLSEEIFDIISSSQTDR